jgi:WD40 repeat protein
METGFGGCRSPMAALPWARAVGHRTANITSSLCFNAGAAICGRSSALPRSLSAGQLNLSYPTTSSDGKKLFALGSMDRAEFVRYDQKSGGFLPYLAGISAEALAFSPDQAWIAYIAYPGKALWRCRADGSERVQLTFPPNETAMPRWSPDGKFLVAESLDSRNLMTYEFRTQTWTRLAVTGNEMIGYSSWSSDSKFVYYNTYSNGAGKILRVSVRTRQPEMVVALKDLDEADTMGRFFTLTPDDRPVVVRDTSIAEIYSLSLQLP